MSDEKKPGLFSRLFGRGKGEDAPQPDKDEAEDIARAPLPDLPAGDAAMSPNAAPRPMDFDAQDVPEETAFDEEAALKAEVAAERALAEAEAAEPSEAVEVSPPAKPAEVDEIPAVIDEDLTDLDPGPPETTPEWIEEHAGKTAAAPEPAKKSWLQRLSTGLKRSSDQLTGNLAAVFTKKKLDQATLDELEDILIQADLGMDTATTITEALARDRFDKEISVEDVRRVLAAEIEKVLEPVAQPLVIDAGKKPFVILMAGVNGSGKTTTIGKLAQKFSADGKKVMLAAGDTFRAAAIEQLQIWGDRTNTPVVTRPAGSDASGLAFDAVTEARAAGSDILIIDTAGRLQNRDELMAELEKIIRVIKKVDDSAPHAVLLTLDATTGQNALNQAEIFHKRAGVTGLVMTKLDGTARGGILVAIARKFGLPVHYIGVGEGVDDLESFAAKDFAEAIAGKE